MAKSPKTCHICEKMKNNFKIPESGIDITHVKHIDIILELCFNMPINKDKDILHFLSINMHKPKIPI